MSTFTRIGLCGLVHAGSAHRASAVQQTGASQRPVWAPVPEASAFAGEIEYSFDTALNTSRVRFQAALGSRRAIVRALFGSPTVHTLITVYEFRGRIHQDRPDSVRVTLISDESRDLGPGNVQWMEPNPMLLISIGDTVLRYMAGIAQRVDEWTKPEIIASVTQPPHGAGQVRLSPPSHEAHIERTATVTISICDFLALVQAPALHGTVAGQEFDLNESVIAGLRQFAVKINADAGSGQASCR